MGIGWFTLGLLVVGTSWADRLSDTDPRARIQAYRAIDGEEDAAAALEQIATALTHEDDPEVRAAAQDALSRLPLSADDLVRVLTTSEEPIARAWSAHSLGRYGGLSSVQILIDAMDDPADTVRGEVYDALGRQGDRLALPALSRVAVTDPSLALRGRAETAALAIARGRNRLDVPTQIAMLEGQVVEDQVAAARALGRSGDWRALQPLLDAATRDGPLAVRQASVLALGQLGNHQVVEEILALAQNASGDLRYAALGALAVLADDTALATLDLLARDADPTTRQLSLRAITWIAPPDAATRLAVGVEDPVERVRTEVVLSLEKIDDPKRVAILIRVLKDPSPFLRAEAARILAMTGAAEAAEALVPCLDDRDALVRLSAAEGLAALRWQPAIGKIETLAKRERNEDQKAIYEAALFALRGE